MKIILASNNRHKLDEISNILKPLGYDIISQSEAGINIEVYNTVGQRVASQVLKGDLNIIPVSTKGVLLVKCGSEVTKVILP